MHRAGRAFGGQQQNAMGERWTSESFTITVLLTAQHAAAMRLAT